MNDKPNSRSVIAAMSQEQRDTLEEWLFEKNYPYKKTIEQCLKEFGVTLHATSVRKFYQQTMQRRALEQIARCAEHADEVVKVFTDNPADTFSAVSGMVGQWAFEAMMDPKKRKNLNGLERLLELLVGLRKDGREEGKFALERERWEFDVARLCFDHHAELQTISSDQTMDEDARLQAIRRRLFGVELPE